MRDKFLTEAMGECWHPRWKKEKGNFGDWSCSKCGYRKSHSYNITQESMQKYAIRIIDFSTWEGFGNLWEWAKEQEWWPQIIGEIVADKWDGPLRNVFSSKSIGENINPDNFANVIYEFLKEG